MVTRIILYCRFTHILFFDLLYDACDSISYSLLFYMIDLVCLSMCLLFCTASARGLLFLNAVPWAHSKFSIC